MSQAVASAGLELQSVSAARLHTFVRFSTGVTVAFILSEAMGWAPTFLAPVLFAVLVTSLPFSPP